MTLSGAVIDAAVGTVRVCKLRSYGADVIGLLLPDGQVRPVPAAKTLAGALDAVGRGRLGLDRTLEPLDRIELLAPVDRQELWSAGDPGRPHGVGRHSLRPRGAAARVAGPADELLVRRGTAGTAPTFEVAVWLDPSVSPIGIGLASDVFVREGGDGAQDTGAARLWGGRCALGPAVLPARDLSAVEGLVLDCSIDRDGRELWTERVELRGVAVALHRRVALLADDAVFPDGAILLTGAGLLPPEQLCLRHADVVTVSSDRLGVLSNRVRVTGA